MGFVPVLLGAVAWSAPFLATAFVVLGWLDLLRPAPRRTLITADRPWGIVLVLWSALVLLYWGSRLADPPPGTRQVLDYVQGAVFAVILAVSFFVLRPASRDLRRGLRLSKQGDLDGAAASYQRALGSGRRGEIPRAAFNLGCVRYRQGDLDGAGAAFRRAIGSGRPDVAGKAALNLGDVLERQGDAEGARAFYRLAIDHGPRDVREHAARALIQLNNAQAQE